MTSSRPRQPQEPPLSQQPLAGAVGVWLGELAQANRSPHTLKAYRLELARLADQLPGPVGDLDVDRLRRFLGTRAHLAPSTRARTQAALASFCGWAYRNGYLDADPMARIERTKTEPPPPRGVPRTDVDRLLGAVPRSNLRDRLLFGLIAELGLRAGEAIGIHVDDLDLTVDDEHLAVLGKGGRRRTVLIDDPKLVTLLKRYLRATGYRHGPLFRAEKNGTGQPMSYQSVHARWRQYCAASGVTATLHQLRHSHATQLVNDNVSLATIRKRLGHRNIQNTMRYANQSDTTADAELRRWRRGRR